ncbi:ankyrin repeat domain-containing protein [Leifsonia sp. 1010]|uniref:ankyrin repeat domain-containing protein n=1 Tax=Leifsonia sp. 1010 TaxID=2817769 RepID=UPI00286BF0DF|nr:ankyrin repeat domain-containing protein [Leifsonia sp. 1010]
MRANGVDSVLLDSEEDLARLVAYNEYIDGIQSTLPAGVRSLLDMSVHDGRVSRWSLGADGVAELSFITENALESLARITLRFFGATALANDADDVETLRLLDGSTELLSQEFDVLDDGRYRFQVLVSPTGELAVMFGDAEVERTPATWDEFVELSDRPDTGRWGRWDDAWLADDPPLHRAAQLGRLDELTALIASGEDVDARDPDDAETPLHAAARRVQVQAMAILISAGATVDSMDHFGRTPLTIASADRDERGLEFLLNAGADPNAGTDEVPLAAAAGGRTSGSVQRLLAAGADVDHRDSDGWTALMYAAQAGNTEAATALIADGADRTALNDDGQSAADIAREWKHMDLLGLLSAG